MSLHPDLCVTAHRESMREGNFTQEEVERLKFLIDASDLAKSALVRNENSVACPLGHACVHFQDRPPQYMKRASVTDKGKKAMCRVCGRAAFPEGFHCDYCEYDLCMVCGIVYCPGGHPMVMWSEPEANATCCSCGKGYCIYITGHSNCLYITYHWFDLSLYHISLLHLPHLLLLRRDWIVLRLSL